MNLLTHHVLRDHVLLGGVASLLLLPCLGPLGSFLFWLANIFVDADHYLHFLYACRGKSWGAGEMFRFHQTLFDNIRRPDFLAIEIFHTIEFLTLFGVLSLWAGNWMIPVFWGCIFHMLVDGVHLGRQGLLFKRVHSFVEYGIRRHRLMQKGLHPDWVMDGSPLPMVQGSRTAG